MIDSLLQCRQVIKLCRYYEAIGISFEKNLWLNFLVHVLFAFLERNFYKLFTSRFSTHLNLKLNLNCMVYKFTRLKKDFDCL